MFAHLNFRPAGDRETGPIFIFPLVGIMVGATAKSLVAVAHMSISVYGP